MLLLLVKVLLLLRVSIILRAGLWVVLYLEGGILFPELLFHLWARGLGEGEDYLRNHMVEDSVEPVGLLEEVQTILIFLTNNLPLEFLQLTVRL